MARHSTSLCKSRAPIAMRRRQGGFTLIEMVAAFVVFALAFGLLMQINTSALRMARHSATYTHATLLAKSMLDQAGVGEPLQEGAEQGAFGPPVAAPAWTSAPRAHARAVRPGGSRAEGSEPGPAGRP